MDGQDEAALGGLPLERVTLEAAGRVWTLDAARDHSRLLAAAEGLSIFPYGLLLWESSIEMADELAKRRSALAGRTVLELGAGVGLAGMAAAACGAKVTQTDISPETLAVCRRNVRRNAITGTTQIRGDWTAWTDPTHYDVVLGADILYEPDLFPSLARVLTIALAPGGTALLTDPSRARSAEFIDNLKANGWSVREETRRVAALPPNASGEDVQVRLWEVVRP